MANKINYQLNFTTDRSNLTNIKHDLEAIQQLTAKELFNTGSFKNLNEADIKLKEIQKEATQVQQALEKSFNSNLGTLNITKFNNELKGLNINKIQQDFYSLGKTGQQAFRDMTTQVLTTNLQLKQSYNWLDQMSKTMSNTIKWGIASSAMNSFTGSIQSAYSFVKKLDTSLNDIRIVTNKSSDEMSKFAQNATKAAKELGASTLDYTQGSLIYYQQGFGDEEAKARAETTLKAANVTGQTGAEVSEQLTAVWNGYKVTADETELYVDKLAAVAASTASDLEELSTGMSKVASAANSAGVDIDQLNAQLATIISVTREAPETVGSSLRTIYARLGDLALDGEDEYGVTLGNISSQMEQLGIQIVDQQGNLRDMGDIIEDTAKKWQTWTDAQKQAAAVAMGGKMQYSRLIALFDNWDMYTDALETSANAMGTLQNQQDIYMESTEAHLQKLNTSWEHFYNSLSEGDTFNGLIDEVSILVDGMSNFVEAIGGGKQALLMLGSIGSQVFSKQLASGIATFITNMRNAKENANQLKAEMDIIKEFGNLKLNDNVVNKLVEMKQQVLNLGDSVTEEERQLTNEYIRQTAELEKQKALYQEKVANTQETYKRITGLDLNLDNQKSVDAASVELKIQDKEMSGYISQFQDAQKLFDSEKRAKIELQRATQSLNDIRKNEANILKGINENKQKGQKLTKIQQQTLQEETVAINRQKKAEESLLKIQSEIQGAYDAQADSAKKLIDFEQASEESIVRLKDAYEKYIGNLGTTKQEDSFKHLMKIASETGAEIQRDIKTVQGELTKSSVEVKKQYDLAGDAIKNNFKDIIDSIDLKKQVKGIVQLASGLSQVTSSIMTLSNLNDIITNDDLSAFEKILQITMALTTSTSMLINGLSLMKTGFSDIKGAIIQAIISNEAFIATNGKVAASSITTGTALKFLTAQVGKFLLVAAPYIAVGLAIVGGTYAIAKAWNASADAAKKSAEAADKAKESYLKANEAAKNLKSTLDSYESAIKSIEELDKGTQEYKQAIIDANEQALKLLETNKELYKYATTNENGLISFSEEGINKILEAQQNMASIELINYYIKQNKANQDKQDNDLLNAWRNDSNKISDRIKITDELGRYGTAGGNIDLARRPRYKQDDGSISTVESFSFEKNGKEILLPLIYEMSDDIIDIVENASERAKNGVIEVTEEEAKAIYKKTGESLGQFDNWVDASLYASKLHESQDYLFAKGKDLEVTELDTYKDFILDLSNYLSDNNLETITPEELFDLDSFQSLNAALQEAIIKNTDEYLNNAKAINENKKQEELMTEQAVQSFLTLQGFIDEDGKLDVEEIVTKQIMTNTGGVNISNEEINKRYKADLEKGENPNDILNKAIENYIKNNPNISDITENSVIDTLFGKAYTFHYNDGTSKKMEYEELPNFIDEYYRLQELQDKAKSANKKAEEVEPIIKSFIDTFDFFGDTDSIKNLIAEFYGDVTEDLSNDKQAYITQEQAQAILTRIMGMDDETLSQTFGYVGDQIQKGRENLIKELQERANLSDVDVYGKMFGEVIKASRTLREDVQSGDVTSKNIGNNEEFKKIQNNLETIKRLYPELTVAAEYFNDTNLVGMQQWYEALDQLQTALETLDIQKAINDAADVYEEIENKLYNEEGELEITPWLETDEFEKQLDEIEAADYQVQIKLVADAEDAYDEMVGALDNLEASASKIGEDYKIAANDMMELAKVFPDILENHKLLADGSVQLDKQIVQSSINTAKEQIAADLEQTKSKLENDAVALESQQITYQKAADAAVRLASLETMTDEEVADAKGDIQEGLALMDQQATQDEMDNNQDIADSANNNARIAASNWVEAWQDGANALATYVNWGAKAQQALAAGEPIGEAPSITSSYQGATGASMSAKEVSGYKEVLNQTRGKGTQAKYAEMAETFQRLADSAGAGAQEIRNRIAALGAQANAKTAGLNSAAAGKGYSPDKSSGSNKDPDQKDYLEDEKDLYHDINIALEQISKNLDRLQKQEKKLFGQKLLDNLNKQLAQLNAKIDATNKKIGIARREAGDLQQELSAKGVQFRSDGTIANYNDAWNAQLTYTNQIIAAYNSMDAEQQEAYKDIVEKAEEDFNKFTENIERYDEIVTEMIPELEDDIQEAVDEKIEIEISKFKMKIDISLDLHQAKKDWLDFKKDIIDKVAEENLIGNFGADLAQFSSYFDGSIQRLTQHIQDTLAQARQMDATGWSDVYGDNQAQLLEDLKTYQDDLMEYLKDLEDLKDQMAEYYSQAMDAAKDAFNRQNEVYEQVQKLYEHDMNLTKLIYGEDSYSSLAKYYDKLNENYNKQLDFQRQEKDLWEQQMNQAEKKMKDLEAAGQTNTKEWYQAKEEFEQAEDNWFNAVNTLNDTIEASVENLIDRYENAIDLIFQKVNNTLTGDKGLDYMNQQWDLLNEKSDQYLDNINRMYETQKIANKYLEAIDLTQSVSAQRELNKLMEGEIKYLREKNKLTQYDIDRAELRYQIALKQIALQEAQQNKTTMRLKRDSQGNYTYQYVADEDQIGAIQDELADLYNRLYNLDKDQVKGNLDEILQLLVDWEEEVKEATLAGDPERAAMLNKEYMDLMTAYETEYLETKKNLNESSLADMLYMYAQDTENYKNMTDEQKAILDAYLQGQKISFEDAYKSLFEQYEADKEKFSQVHDEEMNYMQETISPEWNSVVTDMADKFGGDGDNSLKTIMLNAYNKIIEATTDYENKLNETQQIAGIDFANIRNAIDQTAIRTQSLAYDNAQLIGTYQSLFYTLQNLIQALANTISMYQGAQVAAQAAATDAYNYWTAAQNAALSAQNLAQQAGYATSEIYRLKTAVDALNASIAQNAAANTNAQNANRYNEGGNSVNNSPSGATKKVYTNLYDWKIIDENGRTISTGSDEPKRSSVPSSTKKVLSNSNTKMSQLEYLKKSGRFDTGGYTGEWGSNGKLAILDEKELVLNKEDTSNILETVGIVRNIASSLKTSLYGKVSNLFSNLTSNKAIVPLEKENETLEQNVHIEATFPNVTNSHEIEDAIKNLTNIASQRINNKKRGD